MINVYSIYIPLQIEASTSTRIEETRHPELDQVNCGYIIVNRGTFPGSK